MDDIDYVVLSDISEINPPTDMHRLDDNTFVSFIPMADVSESGEWINQQARPLKDVRNGYTYFQEGDILFAKITPCMENGKGAHAVNLLNGIGFGTTEFHVLRAKSRAHPRFIYHWIMNEELRRKAEARMTGSAGQRRVPASFLREFKVPFLPLPEQRRIAEILDTVDDAIQKTEALISKLKAMKQGLLHDLLTRGLDKTGKLRDPKAHPEQFKDSPLGRIPKEWELLRLLDLVSIPNGQVDPKQKPYCHWPLIAPDHIESDTGRLLCLETAIEQGAISGKYEFRPGDVLYSKIRPYLRKAVLADRQGLCSADMYPLQPGPSLVPRFLLDVILGEHFSRFAASVSERSGFPKINRKELGEYRLALPCQDEQLHIASVMDTYDSRIRTEEKSRDKLKLQKKGLMHDLLTGKVRVNV